MPNLFFPIPNKILEEIVSNLDPLATSCLVLSCRSMAFVLTPTMHLHAEGPKNNEPALHWRSQKGHRPLVQYLLTGFPIDLEKRNGGTPLQAASWSCTNTLSVEYLLHGAAVNHANCFGLTAPYYACRGDMANEDIAEPLVQLLIAHGANAHTAPHAPLTMAVGAGFTRVTRHLLEAGATPDVSSLNGEVVVVSAARQAETVGILELLLDQGADINAVGSDGCTALMMAAHCGTLGSLQLVLDRGANLDGEDHAGNTLLLLAIMQGQWGIAEYLVRGAGRDLHRGNHAGIDPGIGPGRCVTTLSSSQLSSRSVLEVNTEGLCEIKQMSAMLQHMSHSTSR